MTKISVIIPCYNEEMYVGSVIASLLACPSVSEVIAVNDGSIDQTDKIVRVFTDKIKIISYAKNQGKGHAMAEGIKMAKGEIVVFCDGHHLNIKDEYIKRITLPLIKNRADAVLGTTITVVTDPLFWRITGFRAYWKKDLLPLLEEIRKTGFGVEVYLNDQFRGKRVKAFWIKGLVHLTKFDKMSPSQVLSSFLTETREIALTLANTRADTERIKKILDPRKIKSVKTLRAVIRRIKNRKLVSLLRKYILAYLTVS